MRLLNKSLSILLLLSSLTVAQAATVTTLSLYEKDSTTTNNYPLTFGHVFADGDVDGYVQVRYNGTLLTTQCDIKTTYTSGDVRFAIISVILPSISADSTNTIVLETTTATSSSGYMDEAAILATSIEDEIRLTSLSGSGHSGSLTADLNAEIDTADFDYWLQGSVVTEVLVEEELSNSLDARWEVRFYPGTSFGPRISHTIENVEASYRGDVTYAVDIQAGTPSLSSIYSKPSFSHNFQSRWRVVEWIGSEPPEVELHYDIDYLISTGHIPPYDTDLNMDSSSLTTTYSAWTAADTDIMGDGLQHNNFASGDEGSLLQKYAVQYLLSFDNRLREVVLGMGEVTASCPIHFRESDDTKSFYGHIVNIDDRPNVRTSDGSDLPAAIGTLTSQWIVDEAHQWSYNYLPYLITGERWYLDELYYWAGRNLTNSNPGYRDYDTGILPAATQVRGVAWTYRTMVQAAAIAPDVDIEKEYFEDKIANNISNFVTESTEHPMRHIYSRHDDTAGLDASVTVGISGWMQDFLTLALAYGDDLGFDASTILNEFSKFIINRFSHADFNWYNGAAYRFPAATAAGDVSTWAQASSLYSDNPDSFDPVGYAYSYRHKALAALSQVTGYTNGQTAYDWLITNFTAGTPSFTEQREIDPTWALIPRETPVAGGGSVLQSAGTGSVLQSAGTGSVLQ